MRNTVDNKPRSGRPKKLTPRDERHILHIVEESPKTTAIELAEIVQKTSDTMVHPETIRNVLRKGGYHSRIPRKKPLISEVNRKKRMDFVKKYENIDPDFSELCYFH